VLPIDLGWLDGAARNVLVLSAHPDDVEIGAGGTILRLVERLDPLSVLWVVFSGTGVRAEEATASAAAFLGEGRDCHVMVNSFRDGFFPWSGDAIKDVFEGLKGEFSPDLILTHRRNDAHQDHRLVADLTWNTFRNHLILEYEIPKYEGDLGSPNLFVPLDEATAARKVDLLLKGFPSQHHRGWFDAETFWSVLRLRGLESNSPTRYAEGFCARKMVLR
jgi:LmbE family N-acetylglucosaminyl deacetylase